MPFCSKLSNAHRVASECSLDDARGCCRKALVMLVVGEACHSSAQGTHSFSLPSCEGVLVASAVMSR